MNTMRVLAIVAGLCFGIYPLFLNKSGLTGNISSAVFCVAVLIGVLPFAAKSALGGASLIPSSWLMIVGAGVFGALGLLAFNGMLAGVPQAIVGSFFLTMIMVQITVPALYQIVVTGELPLAKVLGLIAAALAAYLLT